MTLHKGTEGWNRARSNLRDGRYSWTKMTLQPSQGYENLVLASPHNASGETLVHAPRADAKRASSVGICLVS